MGACVVYGKKIWQMLMYLCRTCLGAILKCFHLNLTDEKWNICEQFIKFTFVGCSNSVVFLIVYYIVIFMLGKEMYLVGQTFGYVLGVVNSYFWNSRFVFEPQEEKTGKNFWKMCICYFISHVLQVGILYMGIEILQISEIIVPVIAILLTTPLNFVLNKWFAFQ